MFRGPGSKCTSVFLFVASTLLFNGLLSSAMTLPGCFQASKCNKGPATTRPSALAICEPTNSSDGQQRQDEMFSTRLISPEGYRLLDLLDSLHLRSRFQSGQHIDWRSGQAVTSAHQNPFTTDVAKAVHAASLIASVSYRLGVSMIQPVLQRQLFTRDITNWFDTGKASEAGWKRVEGPTSQHRAIRAQILANNGVLVIVSLPSYSEKHGGAHLGIIHPASECESTISSAGPSVTTADVCNYLGVPASTAFRCHMESWSLNGLQYFWFEGSAIPQSADETTGVWSFSQESSNAFFLFEQGDFGDITGALLTYSKVGGPSWLYGRGLWSPKQRARVQWQRYIQKDALQSEDVGGFSRFSMFPVTHPATRQEKPEIRFRSTLYGQSKLGSITKYAPQIGNTLVATGWWWPDRANGNVFGVYLNAVKDSPRAEAFFLGFDRSGYPTWSHFLGNWTSEDDGRTSVARGHLVACEGLTRSSCHVLNQAHSTGFSFVVNKAKPFKASFGRASVSTEYRISLRKYSRTAQPPLHQQFSYQGGAGLFEGLGQTQASSNISDEDALGVLNTGVSHTPLSSSPSPTSHSTEHFHPKHWVSSDHPGHYSRHHPHSHVKYISCENVTAEELSRLPAWEQAVLQAFKTKGVTVTPQDAACFSARRSAQQRDSSGYHYQTVCFRCRPPAGVPTSGATVSIAVNTTTTTNSSSLPVMSSNETTTSATPTTTIANSTTSTVVVSTTSTTALSTESTTTPTNSSAQTPLPSTSSSTAT